MSNIFQLFEKNVQLHSNKKVICYASESLTYSQLEKKVNCFTSALIAMRVKKNEHVAVLLPNGIEFIVVMLAAAKLGAVIVPNNMSLPMDKHWYSFQRTTVKHVIVWHSLLNDLISEKKKLNEKNKELLAFDISSWISVGGKVLNHPDFENLIESYKYEKNILNAADKKSPYIITMTSGSTSEPKPIVLTQHTKILRANSAIELYNISHKDVVLIATPLYHSLAERLLFASLLSGATCVLMSGFSSKKWLSIVESFEITFTIAVSSQLRSILRESNNKSYNIESLRCIVSSSELLDRVSRKKIIESFKCDFHECYGTSEIAVATDISKDGIKNIY